MNKIIGLIFFCLLASFEVLGQNNWTAEERQAILDRFKFDTPRTDVPKKQKVKKDYSHTTFVNPPYRRRASKAIQIFKIEVLDEYTVVSGQYKNFYDDGGWCNMSRNAIIYDCCTGRSHKIIRTEGILMSPEKVQFKSKGQVISFKFYFEPIPHTTNLIDLLAFEDKDDGFNFYDIILDGTQRPSGFKDFVFEPKTAYTVVEEEPEFPGGTSALMEYISKNLRYPEEAYKHGIQGRVTLSFVVEKDGSVSEVEEMQSPAESLTAEAMRVVRSMPKWKPGKLNGNNVRVKYMLPITFRLQ